MPETFNEMMREIEFRRQREYKEGKKQQTNESINEPNRNKLYSHGGERYST